VNPPVEPSLFRKLLRLPNIMSWVRIPMAGLVWLDAGDPIFVLAFLALAGITDMLDGFLARRMYPEDREHLGDWLDPLCDKVFVVSAVAAIFVAFKVPWWIVLLIVTRDLLQVPLFFLFHTVHRGKGIKLNYRALPSGKATTVLQFTAMMAILFYPSATELAAVGSFAMGLWAAAQLVRRGKSDINRQNAAG
jgi:phosphatidylglycerophosphate synthase